MLTLCLRQPRKTRAENYWPQRPPLVQERSTFAVCQASAVAGVLVVLGQLLLQPRILPAQCRQTFLTDRSYAYAPHSIWQKAALFRRRLFRLVDLPVQVFALRCFRESQQLSRRPVADT